MYIVDEPRIFAEWNWERNSSLGLDPYRLTHGSDKKVWWQCPKGHEWPAAISSRVRGRGCPVCSGRRILTGYNDLATTHPGLAKEWHPTKNGDLTPDKVTAGSNKKIWWQCVAGHEWEAVINSRKSGIGCPICAMKCRVIERQRTLLKKSGSLSDTYPELAVEWHPTKNGDRTPEALTAWSHQKVWWLCQKGHSWEAVVSSRGAGNGCPYCSIETHTSFPEQAILFYVSQVYTAENRFVLQKQELDVYIPELQTGIEYNGRFYHSESEKKDAKKRAFFASKGIRVITVVECDENRIMGDLICYRYRSGDNNELMWAIYSVFSLLDKRINPPDVDTVRDRAKILERYITSEKENSLAAKLPEIAKEWNFERNGKLLPEFVTWRSNKKAWWKCAKGHEWEAVINSRKRAGCPFCSGRRALLGHTDLATTHPKIAEEWHPTKNGNLTPDIVSAGSGKMAWWKCAEGHEWEAAIYSRKSGCGCPICARKRGAVNFQRTMLKRSGSLFETHPEIVREWHPTKNGDLTPNMVTAGSAKKVWWKCPKGHEWETRISHRSYMKSGCPICARKRHKAES